MQVAIITPFNFPLEIPALQLMGALYMGNKPILKVDSKVCSQKVYLGCLNLIVGDASSLPSYNYLLDHYFSFFIIIIIWLG